jgi:hypothetical protein
VGVASLAHSPGRICLDDEEVVSQEPLNRQKARWAGKTNRRVELETGEVITAKEQPDFSLDIVIVWNSLEVVGKQSGMIQWWTYPKGVTIRALKEIFDGWDFAGRPDVD